MNVDINGMYVFIERLPAEDDLQLQDRKRWVVARSLATGDPRRALQLSKYYHNILYRQRVYPPEIHRELGIYVPGTGKVHR